MKRFLLLKQLGDEWKYYEATVMDLSKVEMTIESQVGVTAYTIGIT